MAKKIINQKSTKNSKNIQNNDLSQTNIVFVQQQGISYDEAKTIALDVYKVEEAKKFTKESKRIAKKRVESLVTDFLQELINENPECIQKLIKPSIQYTLLNAEKGYAIDETETTKNYYVDILKSRISAEDRSMLQIFEDEAIKIVEKLTKTQMNYLTFMFLTYSYPYRLNDSRNVEDYCNKLCELYDEKFNNPLNLISLEAIGACTPLGGARNMKPIQQRLYETIPGMFYKGQTKKEIVNLLSLKKINDVDPLIVKYVWDNNLYQLDALDLTTLKVLIDKYNYCEYKDKLINMYNNQVMSMSEIKEKLIEINPKMDEVIKFWDDSEHNSRRITPQGIIIAISNYNSIYDEKIKYEDYLYE